MKVIDKKINTIESYVPLDTASLKVGDVLVFNIFLKQNELYTLVIRAGVLLTQNLYDRLNKEKNIYISKKDDTKQVLTCKTLKYYIKYNYTNPEKRLNLLYDVTNKLFDNFLISNDDIIDLECVEQIAKSIVFLVKYDEKFLKNTMPFFINDTILSVHSLHAALYAVNIGNLLNFKEKELLHLATAALLIDIGLKRINPSILDKEAKLSQQEIDIVNKHVQYSVDIARKNHFNEPIVINAIRHHHERFDGSGYPQKQKGEEISEFASILAICDVFDAMTNNRPHRKEHTSFSALTLMIKDPIMKTKFNPKYLHLFLKSL